MNHKKLKKLFIMAALTASATLFTGCFSMKDFIEFKKEKKQTAILGELDFSNTQNPTPIETPIGTPVETPAVTPTPENDAANITTTPLPTAEPTNPPVAPPTSTDTKEPFYGIWCHASKNQNEAAEYAVKMQSLGFNARVFITTDWSNLNSEHWYVVTAGVYSTKDAANAALSNVKAHYKDAYVKYSGNYQGASSDNSAYHNPPNYAQNIADDKYFVFISEFSDNGVVTCQEGYFIADGIHPGNKMFEIGCSSNLQILTFDPNDDYGPETEAIPTTIDTFKQMIHNAVAWNGNGFICEITVSGGVVTQIEEFYLP